MTTAFAQRDVRWAAERLGQSSLTIGQAGCLVTALASLLADWGVATDPRLLNARLTVANGYVGGNRVRFAALAELGAHLVLVDDCFRHRAPARRLREALRNGQGVVALIDTRPGRVSRAHWVRLLACDGGECQVMDPWQPPGAEVVGLLAEYGAPGWDVGRAVYVYAVYQRQAAAVCDAAAEQGVVSMWR